MEATAIQSEELDNVQTVARVRLSGQVVTGVGVLEYFDNVDDALSRRMKILDEAPKALLEVADVQCVLDDDGSVLAELEE